MEVSTRPQPPAADTDVWAREALTSLAALPGVRRVGLALAEGGGRRLLFTASDRLAAPGEGSDLDWCHIDAYEPVPLNATIRTGVPVHGMLSDLDPRFGDFVARQQEWTRAVAAVPVRAAGQTLGAFVLFLDVTAPLDPSDLTDLLARGEALGARLRRAQRVDEELSWEPETDLPPPPSAGRLVALHDLGPHLSEARSARAFLERTLLAWGIEEDPRESALLCLSELVTNALIHTHGGCRVRATLEDGVLTVAVRDRGHGRPRATLADADPLAVHGRGLHVVEALSSRWGSDLSAAGTTVWFVLDL